MFDLFGNSRIESWRLFRDNLETSESPWTEVAAFWAKAPFVNNYLDPFDYKSWPDPWQLILDGKFDNLAIVLGICYTLSLTQRFSKSRFEIHKSINDKKNSNYYLVVDNEYVFNLHHGEVASMEEFKKIDSYLIWKQ